MDWDRCSGRFPFCWSSTVPLLRGAAEEPVEEGSEGGDGLEDLSGSQK